MKLVTYTQKKFLFTVVVTVFLYHEYNELYYNLEGWFDSPWNIRVSD